MRSGGRAHCRSAKVARSEVPRPWETKVRVLKLSAAPIVEACAGTVFESDHRGGVAAGLEGFGRLSGRTWPWRSGPRFAGNGPFRRESDRLGAKRDTRDLANGGRGRASDACCSGAKGRGSFRRNGDMVGRQRYLAGHYGRGSRRLRFRTSGQRGHAPGPLGKIPPKLEGRVVGAEDGIQEGKELFG